MSSSSNTKHQFIDSAVVVSNNLGESHRCARANRPNQSVEKLFDTLPFCRPVTMQMKCERE